MDTGHFKNERRDVRSTSTSKVHVERCPENAASSTRGRVTKSRMAVVTKSALATSSMIPEGLITMLIPAVYIIT
jgi:hypothetical protein